jgi:hypothetical protein
MADDELVRLLASDPDYPQSRPPIGEPFAYPYGRPRFPNMDPRAYFDRDTQMAYAKEPVGDRMKESGMAGLPLALLATPMRDRAMGKMMEAQARLRFNNNADHAGGYVPFDRGITGGITDLERFKALYPMSKARDSAMGIAESPGVTAEPFRPAFRDLPAANDISGFKLIPGGKK